MKKNETTKNNNCDKSKDKVAQSFNNALSQQCIGCQGYGHLSLDCPTYLRSKGKTMAVTLSDDEVFDHEFEGDQEGNFMAFTANVVVSESEIVDENLFYGELSENVDL